MEQDEHKREMLNVEDVLALLRAEVAKSGSQIEWARQHGVDRSCVCAAINGTKPLQPKIIRALGLKATIAYSACEGETYRPSAHGREQSWLFVNAKAAASVVSAGDRDRRTPQKSAHLLSFVQSASNRVRSPSSTARGRCSSFSLDTAFGFDAVTFEA